MLQGQRLRFTRSLASTEHPAQEDDVEDALSEDRCAAACGHYPQPRFLGLSVFHYFIVFLIPDACSLYSPEADGRALSFLSFKQAYTRLELVHVIAV